MTIAWHDGSEHLALWGAMAPSGTQFPGGAGRQSWMRFVFNPNRPLIRIVARQVTQPGGATIFNATELVLRLRVQNFAATPGLLGDRGGKPAAGDVRGAEGRAPHA